MNRLDQHISSVRNRMIFTRALWALAWAGIAYAVIVWGAVLVYKLVSVTLPHQFLIFQIVLALALIAAVAYAIITAPSAQAAAVAIDERLALKEKFSTALFARNSTDPFAQAAVKDAEKTAENVSLHKRFPIEFPRVLGGTAGMALLVLLTVWLLPPFDLLKVEEKRTQQAATISQSQVQAREQVRKAIAEIAAAPKTVTDKQDIKLAVADMQAMLNKPEIDPTHASNTAKKAMQELSEAMKDKVKQNSEYASAQQQVKEFAQMTTPIDETGPLGDAHKDLKEGNLDKAVDDLSKAVSNFDKMSQKDQEKTASQMKALAKEIDKVASDKNAQQQMQKDLAKFGADQQQTQQIMNNMQAAAAGDPKAQQAVQQAAKQLAQKMNQQGGQTATQQKQNANQVQQAMNQMQQNANTQAAAQQLSQAAQSLANAMAQVAASNSQNQQGNPQQQQANNSQNKQQQAGGAKQQQANGNQQPNQPGQQPGNQPGQPQQGGGNKPGQPGGQQQMADAAQQMQQQLQQMQAIANDAKQVASAQKNQGNQPGDQPGDKDGPNGNQGQQGNGGQGHPGNTQQWAQNKGQGQPGGAGGVGQGGQMPRPNVAPFQIKDETDLSDKNEKGKVLASTFVKAGTIKGESKLDLRKVLPVADKNTPDEIDEQRVPRQDQDAVRGYFNNLEKQTK